MVREIAVSNHTNTQGRYQLMKHYTYLITNCQEEKCYIGVRSCECDPIDDIGKKYFSSSSDKNFKKDQKNNPQNYQYQVLELFETKNEALLSEIDLHEYFDVGRNIKFYNCAKQKATGFCSAGVSYSKDRKMKVSDQKIYTFIHDAYYGIRVCTRFELMEEFPNLTFNGVHRIISQKYRDKTHQGWRLDTTVLEYKKCKYLIEKNGEQMIVNQQQVEIYKNYGWADLGPFDNKVLFQEINYMEIITPNNEVILCHNRNFKKTCKDLGLPLQSMYDLLKRGCIGLRGKVKGFKISKKDK